MLVEELLIRPTPVVVLLVIVTLIVVLVPSVWTYRDTRQHNRETLLWLSITLTLPVVGFAIYVTMGRGQFE